MQFLLAGIALLLTSGVNSLLINAALDSYWMMAKLILPLTVGTALLRIIMNQLSFGTYGTLKEVLRDTIKFILLVAMAPILIKNSLTTVDFIADKIVDKSQYLEITKNLEFLAGEHSLKEKAFSLWHIDESVYSDLFQLFVRSSVLMISTLLKYMRDIVLAIFVSAMPLFLYMGLMLGLRFFVNTVLSMGVTLLIWPILSALLMHFSMMVYKADSPNSWTTFSQCASLLIYAVAQLLLPFLTMGAGLMAASSLRKGVADAHATLMKVGSK
jgi:hypothetical protein